MRKRLSRLVLVAGLTVAGAAAVTSSIPYFTHARSITVTAPGHQNFVVMDEPVWLHARPDLDDLRIYSASGSEIPYALQVTRGNHYMGMTLVSMLNKGEVNGNTQFTLDISSEEYDRLVLEVTVHDFVAKALVEGSDQGAGPWNNLGSYSLYDFTKEKLGANKVIRLSAPSRYRYLRITISGPIKPEDVTSIKVANLQEEKARYVTLSARPSLGRDGNRTVARWEMSDHIPVERVTLVVDSAEVNFSRRATLYCDDKRAAGADFSRVRLLRKERKIECESLALDLPALKCKKYRLEIENGDDPPLKITSVQPMMLERRVYFYPRDEHDLKLYYGDERLTAPVYDFAKFFAEDKSTPAALQAEEKNTAFTGRPDDRPFSERHPVVMWAAMLLAVGLLGAWALKGFSS